MKLHSLQQWDCKICTYREEKRGYPMAWCNKYRDNIILSHNKCFSESFDPELHPRTIFRELGLKNFKSNLWIRVRPTKYKHGEIRNYKPRGSGFPPLRKPLYLGFIQLNVNKWNNFIPTIYIPQIMGKKSTCKLLEQHRETLKNDPERLSTDFIKTLIRGGEKLCVKVEP